MIAKPIEKINESLEDWLTSELRDGAVTVDVARCFIVNAANALSIGYGGDFAVAEFETVLNMLKSKCLTPSRTEH